MRPRWFAVRVVVVSAAVVVAAAATGTPVPGATARPAGGQQSRDAVGPPTTGTAVIAGVVVDDQEPAKPVRRAVVTLSGEGLRPSRGAITDDDGRFELRGLPAGRFTLMAERGAYVTSAYGAKRPGRPGTAITVTDGAQVTDVRVRLWRGAVVSGVLRDETGAPVGSTMVEAVPAREVTIGLTFSNNGLARTDDRGEYRIFGLVPGTYVVRASRGPTGIASRSEIAHSEAEIDAIFAALAARGRGPAAVATPAASGASAGMIPVTGTHVNAAPIYFPGTPVVTAATPIVLAAGEARSGLDFVVRRVAVAQVRGVVVGPDGSPVARAFVHLGSTVVPTSFAGAMPAPIAGTTGADGSFDIGPVSPGDYRLLIRGDVGGAGGPAGALPWWADVAVTATGADIDLSTVSLRPGLTFAGRLRFAEGGATPPADLAGMRVILQSDTLPVASGSGRGRGGGTNVRVVQPGAVGADGRFEITGLVPGEYRLDVGGGVLDGSGWWLRSAMWQDRDLLDAPLRVGPDAPIRDATLVLSDRRTELSGTIATSGGAAVTDLFVLAYPADAALRASASRRIRAVRPDSAGRFVFDRLPAGDYLLCALGDVDDGAWNEPGFLDQLVTASIAVTLRDGESKVQDLQVR
ncbi:MAG: carboxypeptidase-like regulatory domain-containing protein [Vicinamibacterales bacterium]